MHTQVIESIPIHHHPSPMGRTVLYGFPVRWHLGRTAGDTKASWTAAPEEGYERLRGSTVFSTGCWQVKPGETPWHIRFYFDWNDLDNFGHVATLLMLFDAICMSQNHRHLHSMWVLLRWLPHETLTVADDHVPVTEEPPSPPRSAENAQQMLASVLASVFPRIRSEKVFHNWVTPVPDNMPMSGISLK